MKKRILFLCGLLGVSMCLSGCSYSFDPATMEQDVLADLASQSSYNFATYHGDWPFYETADEVVEAASNIFSGKVIDISFEILDTTTGKAVNSYSEENPSLMLYTVYTVEVENSIKGTNPPKSKFCRIGGTIGHNEEKQYELAEASRILSQYQGIPGLKKSLKISLDETYVFCTKHMGGDYDYVINPLQFAYPEGTDNAKALLKVASAR